MCLLRTGGPRIPQSATEKTCIWDHLVLLSGRSLGCVALGGRARRLEDERRALVDELVLVTLYFPIPVCVCVCGEWNTTLA